MYKYYKKNEYNIMYHYFDSIIEYLNYLDNTPIANGFQNYDLSSEDTDYDWYKTNSLDEAKELIKYGYNENFDRFLELKLKLEKYIKLSVKKNKQYNYYVGYAPDVKAYLEGNPLSMLNKEKEMRKQIDIYFNIACACYTDNNQIFNRGVITLSLIEVLESLGFNVNLNLFEIASCNDQLIYFVWNFKNIQERSNIRKLYFPMCHPSFLRRLSFRLREETKDINSSWQCGYGRPGDDSLVRKIIDLKENDIVISQPSEMGISGLDLIDDANNMYDIIKRKTNIEDFELKKILKK